ncbi:peptidoglycan-binding protein [Cellvibrio sp. KY-GH-1]|uniref:peptidoglycan-binding domain-containing protein n=1 Tax=Cellvibrio sp. KY-GH-1 TaxID=2303332 RepID=UPI0012481CF6|nr:peptidoglycan-binding domain-containing protein [Cellvibrio sp. KY-GH-1]QEY18611.1 peptidoglycan-binding protein [Cellvibrio sp. KY-GH-1]
MCDELQSNFEAEYVAGEWSDEADEVRNQRRPPGARRPPVRPPKYSRPRVGIAYVKRGGFSAEPYAIEAGGSEKIRWIQECLNHKSGLQLPVNGIAGRETRSAIRDFQRKQGVRVNGLIDPDTERALREFCRQADAQFVRAPTQEEIGHPDQAKFDITLEWVKHGNSYLHPLDQAIKRVGQHQGGVYIMIGDPKSGSKKSAKVCGSCTKDCVLKVGIAEEFRSRFFAYLKPSNQWPNQCSWDNLRVYMATIKGFYNLDRHVERALDQLLRKVGKQNSRYLLSGSRPVGKQSVNSGVTIHNILPPSSPLLVDARQHFSGDNLVLKKGSVFSAETEIQPVDAPVNLKKRCSCQTTKKCTCDRCTAKSCQNCGTSPCQCGTCSPGCSCARCKQKRVRGNTSGNWQRYGNQIQVLGV